MGEALMEKIGIHAFVWTGSSRQTDLERAVEVSHDLGYSLIEFPRLDPTAFDVPALARLVQARKMEIVVTMGLPKGSDISSEDRDEVKRGEKVLREAVSVCRDLGAKKLGGIIFSMHGKYYNMPTEAGWRNSSGVIADVARAGAEAGVTLVVEIVNRFESNLLNTTAQGLKFIADTGSSNVKLHLDTFHMNIEEASPADAIRAAGDKLGYFHIGESNRGYLGAGTVDFDSAFDALLDIGYDDYLTFESFSSEVVDKDLSITAGIWRNTWSDNVALARHAKEFIEEGYTSAKRRRAITRTP
jgi:D-psicose/D-tagatose/L-ribulose 3-epimerase